MKDKIIIGVDIGGTNTVIGMFNPSMKLLSKRSFLTMSAPALDESDQPHDFLDCLSTHIKDMLTQLNDAHFDFIVGIGAPGRVDNERGIVLSSSNLRWINVELAAQMSERLKVPVIIDNDVRMYTLGEVVAGAAQGYNNVICTTLGTGMAAAYFVEGKLVRGEHLYAGEIGHDYVNGNSILCNCGRIGCLETIVSGGGIVRLAEAAILANKSEVLREKRASGPLTSMVVYEACLLGDQAAIGIFHNVAMTLINKLLTAMFFVDPGIVVVGGGLAKANRFLLDPMREVVVERYNRDFAPKICASKLGDEAGIFGAAHMAKQMLGTYQFS